jgi:hypothetical protein
MHHHLGLECVAPALDHGPDQVLLRAETILHAALGDAGRPRDGIEGQTRSTALSHNPLGGIQYAVAIYAARSSCHSAPSISIQTYLYSLPRAGNLQNHTKDHTNVSR